MRSNEYDTEKAISCHMLIDKEAITKMRFCMQVNTKHNWQQAARPFKSKTRAGYNVAVWAQGRVVACTINE